MGNMEKINNFNESELLKLKTDINKQLKIIDKQLKIIEIDKIDTIKRKDSVKTKTKLCELTSNDRIFSIGVSNNLDVYFMDYCDIRGYNDKTDSDYHDISVRHKTKPYGISTSIHKDESEKHYFTSFHSIICFFTLNPETWKEDLQESLIYKIKQEKKHLNEDIKNLKNQIKTIIKSEDKINDYVSKL